MQIYVCVRVILFILLFSVSSFKWIHMWINHIFIPQGSGQVIKELKEAKPAVHSERRISAKPEMYAYRKIGEWIPKC